MADCLIIGGGISGLLVARELATAGATVTLLERGAIGREASWAGGGILSPLYPWRYPEAVTRLALWGQRRYPDLLARLEQESGVDPEYEPSGLLVLGADEGEQALAWAAAFGVSVQEIDAAAARTREPALGPDMGSALWLPAVGQVRNPRLVRALKGSAAALGVILREGVEVLGLEVERGRLRGVRTRAGTLAAATVLLAGGAWSGRILAEYGATVPVKPVLGQMILYRAEPGVVRRIVLGGGRYVIPRRDGRVLVGSTLEDTGFDKAVTDAARAELAAAANRLAPALGRYAIEHHWAGLRPGSPDGVPLIGPHPEVDGLYVNAGHYRNGVVLGPASARLAADLILGREPILDPTPYLPVTPRCGDYAL